MEVSTNILMSFALPNGVQKPRDEFVLSKDVLLDKEGYLSPLYILMTSRRSTGF